MRPIYHITHVDNLPGIIGASRLWSDARRRAMGFDCTNIGHPNLKQKRLHRAVDKSVGGTLGEYVPFNFCNRSVMLYPIHKGRVEGYHGGQAAIVHLVSSIEAVIASQRPWAFTDVHPVLAFARFFDSLDDLDQVDWSVMPQKYWSSKGVKEYREAEFLVHDWFPWGCVQTIGVYSPQIANRVRGILVPGTHQPPVEVRREWYY